MQIENWEKVKELLEQVSELEETQRQEFLDKSNISAEIRAEIESLISFEDEADNLMNFSAIEFSKDFFAEVEPNALIGQQIGVYQIIRELGYGGMGVVYLAERNDGKFKQKVALKLLKREMNTSDLRRRFQQERHILASLEHSNIARLLHAGTTDDKVPFLAMEYIEGLPIDDYCNKHHLDLGQRLDLFRKVCEAVNFAHRNLVVHRDLKPSNILVNQDGVPKLLDFGISKIISGDFEQNESATVTRMGAMTPGYASPEQLRKESVSTATDIYSLGVILYELLSGHRPFEEKEHDLKEIFKAVLETDPTPPSAMIENISRKLKAETKVKTELKPVEEITEKKKASNSFSHTGANKIRYTLPNAISLTANSLRGDLDNIVLKALRKEPVRRYSSAENLAEDIHRHQRGLPVTARPNTFSYRAEKFFQRNKVSVFAGILILLAVIGGILTTFWQARVARLEAEKSKKVNEYMRNVLNFSNPSWVSSNPKRNREAKIADALDEALKNIDTDLANEPEIQAEILMTIGSTYVGQAQYDKALPILQRSIEKFDQVLGEDNPKSIQAFGVISNILFYTGKQSEAEKVNRKVLDYYRSHPPSDEIQIRDMVANLNDLANIQNYNSNFAEAEKLYREAIELAKKLSGKNRGGLPGVLGNLAWLLHSKGDFAEALNYYNQAHQEIRNSGNEDKVEAGILFNKIGVAYNEMGDYQNAEIYYQRAYPILTKQLGEENFYTVSTMYRNAYNYYKQGKLDESEKLVNGSLEIQRKMFPNGHNVTAYSERLLGEIYTNRGDLKKGEEFLRKALYYLLQKTKEPNRDISLAKASLGENLTAQKRFAEAKEILGSALDGSIKNVGEDHHLTKKYRELLSKIPE